MKILQINAVNKFISTGRNCGESADYMNKKGHEARIAHARGPGYVKGFRIGNPLDHKVHALLSRITGLQGYYSRGATRGLIRYISEFKPDAVHLHDLHSNYINLGLLFNYLAEKDIPTVLTLHDCWFFTGKCTYYTAADCFKWIEGCNRCPQLGNDNPSWVFDRTRRMHEDKKRWLGSIPRLAVVGVSDWITEEAKKSFLSSAKIITRIYNWVDTDVFRPVDASETRKNLGLEDKFVVLGVSGKWSRRKGFSRFVELAGKIPPDAAIVLVGGLERGAGLPGNMLGVPETPSEKKLAEYYSMADVFLQFSAEETFGKVAAEALACGTPVITNDLTANPELAAEGTGFVLGDYSAEAALGAVLKVKEKGKQNYADVCVSSARKKFDKKDRIADYLKVYEEVSGKRV